METVKKGNSQYAKFKIECHDRCVLLALFISKEVFWQPTPEMEFVKGTLNGINLIKNEVLMSSPGEGVNTWIEPMWLDGSTRIKVI